MTRTAVFAPLRWLVALALLVIAFGCAQGDEEPAVAAVDAWLAIVDSGELGLAWDQSASTFRNELAKEAFETSIRDSRAPLGSFVSRKVRSAQAARSLPGAPRGRYVVIHYDSVFENQKSAVESLTAVYEEDEWRVLGYRSR